MSGKSRRQARPESTKLETESSSTSNQSLESTVLEQPVESVESEESETPILDLVDGGSSDLIPASPTLMRTQAMTDRLKRLEAAPITSMVKLFGATEIADALKTARYHVAQGHTLVAPGKLDTLEQEITKVQPAYDEYTEIKSYYEGVRGDLSKTGRSRSNKVMKNIEALVPKGATAFMSGIEEQRTKLEDHVNTSLANKAKQDEGLQRKQKQRSDRNKARDAWKLEKSTSSLESMLSSGLIGRGKISRAYRSRYDTGGKYSVEYAIKNLPEVIIHVHCSTTGKVQRAHWKKTQDRYKVGVSEVLSTPLMDLVSESEMAGAKSRI